MLIKPSARRAAVFASVSAAALALSSCGGGGSGGGSGGGAASNRAPQITSASTASVTENAISALTLAASDADGDTVSFAVTGGADAGAFTVSGTSLAFRNAADFERPADANRDNMYNVTIEARDGRGGVASADLVVTVTNSKEGIAITRVASGFASPVGLGALLVIGTPAGKIAVAQTTGEIFEVDGTTGARTLLADVFASRPRGRLLAITYYSRPSNFYGGLHAVV